VVHRVRNLKSGEIFAAKVISKSKLKTEDLGRLEVELAVLQQVDHPNIISLKEVFETNHMLYIVTELVTGGELFDRIVSRGSYTERDAAGLVKKLIEAIAYLHTRGIVHRDIKPENLLLSTANEDTQVKIADFGLSKILGDSVMMQTACGTPGYVAPEILASKGYGKEVDMWSIGVVTYILVCGFPPFYNENIPLLFESIMKADFDFPLEHWEDISDDCMDFIDQLLVVDPAQRLTAEQALEHSWLQGNAPPTPLLKAQSSMSNYTFNYRQMSQMMGPSSAEESSTESPCGSAPGSMEDLGPIMF
jgi:calcium/calmodulin-dependent protein kinase I